MPQYWYVVAALVALGRQVREASKPFTRVELRRWSADIDARPRSAPLALQQLESAGLLRKVNRTAEDQPAALLNAPRYVITTEGKAAAEVAYTAWKRKALSEAGAKATRVRSRDSLCNRLWLLFRMRRTLTGAEAAETLVDAGEDVGRVSNMAARYLRQWSLSVPDAVQCSKKRGPHGAMRYVMVKDLGPQAPVITPTPKAQGGAV